MTPQLSVLLAAADAAKQSLAIHTAANETAAKLADAAQTRHKECYAAVVQALGALSAARADIDAALDADYGAPATVYMEADEPEPAVPQDVALQDPTIAVPDAGTSGQ